MRQSLRVKILLFTVLALFLVAGLLGWYFFKELKKQVLQRAFISVNLTHEKYYSQVNTALQNYEFLFKNWQVIAERFSFAKMLEQFDEVRADLSRYATSQLRPDSLQPAFRSVFILNADSASDATDEILVGSDNLPDRLSAVPWSFHLQKLREFKVFYSDVLSVFVYMLPLTDHGEVIGYLLALTDLSDLKNLLLDYNEALTELGFSGSLCFLEQNQVKLWQGSDNFTLPQLDFLRREVFVDREYFFLSSEPLAFPDGTTACLGNLINKEPVFAGIQQMLRISIIASLLVCSLFSILLSIFLHTSIIKPIYALKQAASEIEKGKLVRHIAIYSHDEMGELAESFVHMSTGISKANLSAKKLISNLENLPAPVFEVDLEGRLVFVNKAYIKFIDRQDQEELLGNQCTNFLTFGQELVSGLEDCLKKGEMVEKETIGQLTDQKTIPIRITGLPLFDDNHQIYGALGFLVDMSDTYSVAASVQKSAGQLSRIFAALQSKTNEIFVRVDALEERSTQVSDSSKRILSGIEIVVSATDESLSSVTEVDSGMNKIAKESNTALSSAQVGSNNLANVAGKISEVSESVEQVTSAVEDMNNTFTEIERNTVKALDISKAATKQAQFASDTMQRLNDVSNQVAKVLGVIGRIADQTNMLALNATIEAASAGDAGKGFGVVAAEVKELARQSASSAEQISEHLNIMQEETKTTVEAMQQVFAIVNELNQLNEANTKNIRAQSMAARHITESMILSSANIRAIDQDAQSTSDLMNNIVNNIRQTNEVSSHIFVQSRTASTKATEIADSSRLIAADIALSNENANMANAATVGVRHSLREAHQEIIALQAQIQELSEVIKDFRLLKFFETTSLTNA